MSGRGAGTGEAAFANANAGERKWTGLNNRSAEATHFGGGHANGGERSEPPGKGTAQRAKRAEARGIAAEIGAQRRLKRKARSRSDAPGIKKTNQGHRSDGSQHWRKLLRIVVLPERTKQTERLRVKESGAAAAERGAEGDARQEGRLRLGVALKRGRAVADRREQDAPGVRKGAGPHRARWRCGP